MKKLSYKLMREVNIGTEEAPVIVQTLHDVELVCARHCYEENYAAALAEAYGAEVQVEDLPEEETVPDPQDDTDAMLVDLDYRVTLLELGLTE